MRFINPMSKIIKDTSILTLILASSVISSIVTGILGYPVVYLQINSEKNLASLNAQAAVELEREKLKSGIVLEKKEFETNLILKAIETGDVDAAKRNLQFFLEAGFIEDPDGTIVQSLQYTDSIPVLPPSSGLYTWPDGKADPRLEIGMKVKLLPGVAARVLSYPPTNGVLSEPLEGEVVRYWDSFDSTTSGEASIVGGPVFSIGDTNTIVWWLVRFDDNTEGWVPSNTSEISLLVPAQN